MLPNFIHVGAAKCASSWLWRVYQEHPDVYVPLHLDNVNFFVADYHKGLDWYQKTYFGDWCGEKAVGEMSNSYMVAGDTWAVHPERLDSETCRVDAGVSSG